MSLPQFATDQFFYFVNVAYPAQVIDLVNGNPKGPIDGFKEGASQSQAWSFPNEGQSPEIYYIKNEAGGTYASVSGEFPGAALFGSQKPCPWILVPVSGSQTVYQVMTQDKQFVWVLQSSDDFTTISLLPANSESYEAAQAQWTFKGFQ